MARVRSNTNGAAWTLMHGSTIAAQEAQKQQQPAPVSGPDNGADPW